MKVKFCALFFYCHREATCVSKSNQSGGFSKRLWLFEEILANHRIWTQFSPDKQKSLASEETRLFPSGSPNRDEQVTEGHDAERARDSIMPRSAAT